jgi:hypothetical protein
MTVALHLRIGKKPTGLVMRQDNHYPGMWRIFYRGMVSDMVNLTRAKDAAIGWVRPRGLGSNEIARWNRRETPDVGSPVRFRSPPVS